MPDRLELTERQQQMLRMAGSSYKRQGTRESDIQYLFTLTPTAFYQQVNSLIDTEHDDAWNPMLVRRLRALRGSEGRPRVRRLGVSI